LNGVDAFVITMSVSAPPDTQAKLVKAAVEAGVKWILPNEFGGTGDREDVGAAIMIGPAKKEIRNLIESLGASWIGVGCGFWYEFSLGGGTYRYGFDFRERSVMFFDEGEQVMNTSTLPQCGRGTAAVLSLPLLPTGPDDTAVTVSHYRNKFIRVSSFAVNQKDMFESVKRVTGTTDADWKISSRPAKECFDEGMQELKAGNREGFGKLMYTRTFFPGDDAMWFEKYHGTDNEKLGLPKEDLDEWTRKGIELGTSDYYAKHYGS
jgi:hypothetical protein